MKKRTVTLIDDYDGSQADETVIFGLDGVNYEIDLSAANAKKLRGSIQPWSEHGRRTAGRLRKSHTAKSDLNAIREWAVKNGHNVAARGRIAAEVVEAYNSSTPLFKTAN
jgi:hypothetical protein